jgi:hypothetical protein
MNCPRCAGRLVGLAGCTVCAERQSWGELNRLSRCNELDIALDPELVDAARLTRSAGDGLALELADQLAAELESPLRLDELALADETAALKAAGEVLGAETGALAQLQGFLTQADTAPMIGPALEDLLNGPHPPIAIVRTALTFLKARRYAEAAEWCRLQRSAFAATSDRFALLLLLLEALTWDLGHDSRRAQALLEEARSHAMAELYLKPG